MYGSQGKEESEMALYLCIVLIVGTGGNFFIVNVKYNLPPIFVKCYITLTNCNT
jgi:hypothetical protein